MDKFGGLARWLAVLLVMPGGAIFGGCKEAPKAAAPVLQAVKVAPVIQRDVPIYREWIGTTVGYVTAQIRPKVSGYLVSQDYREGTLVMMQRAPWLVAGGFGLLHGLGFAGALTAVGLPQGEIPLALFAFNLGIELSQLAFVAVVLALMAALGRLQVRWPRWVTPLPAYAIGSLAIYWLLERLVRQVAFRI